MDTAQLPAFLAGLGIGVAACGGMIVALRVQRAAYLDLRERMQARENEERERYRYALAQGAVPTNEARAILAPQQTAVTGEETTGPKGVITLDEIRRAAPSFGPMTSGRHGEDTQ